MAINVNIVVPKVIDLVIQETLNGIREEILNNGQDIWDDFILAVPDFPGTKEHLKKGMQCVKNRVVNTPEAIVSIRETCVTKINNEGTINVDDPQWDPINFREMK